MFKQPIVTTPSGFGFIHPSRSVCSVELRNVSPIRITYLTSFLSYGESCRSLNARALACTSEGDLHLLLLSRSPAFLKTPELMPNEDIPCVVLIATSDSLVTGVFKWPFANVEPCGIILDQGRQFLITALDDVGRCVCAHFDADRGSFEIAGLIENGSQMTRFESPQLIRIESEIHVIDTFAQVIMSLEGADRSQHILGVEPGSCGGPVDSVDYGLVMKAEQGSALGKIRKGGGLKIEASWNSFEIERILGTVGWHGEIFCVDRCGAIWAFTSADSSWKLLSE